MHCLRSLFICLMVLGLLAPPAAFALDPEIRFHHYQLDRWRLAQGFPLATLTALAQDRRGFLWVGTQNGLARFDGVGFRLYRTGDYPGLVDNHIRDLELDGNGRLWVVSGYSPRVYDQGVFRSIDLPGERSRVSRIVSDGGGVWLGGEDGLFRVAAQTATPETRAEAVGGLPGAVHSLAPMADGVVSAGGVGWVARISDAGSEIFRLPQGDGQAALVVNALTRYRDTLWIGTERGLFRLGGGNVVPVGSLGDRNVQAFEVDGDGLLWVATTKGLYRFDGMEVVDRVEDETVLYNLWNEDVLEDRQGNLWLAAKSGGLVRIRQEAYRVFGPNDGLTSPEVWAVDRDREGDVRVGAEGGVFEMVGGRFRPVLGIDVLPGPTVGTLLHDSKGRLWVGTSNGVAVFRDGRPVLEPLPEFPATRYYAIHEDRDGRIWLGHRGGLLRYQPSASAGAPDKPMPVAALAGRPVRSILERPDGSLWVTAEAGVFRIGAGGDIRRIDTDVPGAPFALSIAAGETAELWWTYVDQGLVRFRDGEMRRFTTRHGLPTNTILHAAENEDGYLWLSTLQGVFRVPVAEFDRVADSSGSSLYVEPVVSVDSERDTDEVLCCHGGTDGAAVFRPDGTLLLPTFNGLMAINTRRFQPPKAPPTPVIDSVETGDEREIPVAGNRVTAGPEDRDLTIHYTALDLSHPEHLRFRYRLRGLRDEWRDAGERRKAFYTNLPAGEYEFEVLAVNRMGMTSPEPARVKLELTPALTETLAFRAMVLAVLAGMAYGLHRAWTRRLRHQRNRLESEVDQRTRELSRLNAELSRANLQLESLSQTDQLTQLRNRRFLDAEMPKEIARLKRQREAGHPAAALELVVIDLDHFKDINDQYGHAAGDEVLRAFARTLTEISRRGDHLVRLGGEEFLMVVQAGDDLPLDTVPRRICERFRDKVFSPAAGVSVRVAVSVGAVRYPFLRARPFGLNFREVLQLADLAMYEVKEAGRDGWATLSADASLETDDLSPVDPERVKALIRAGRLMLDLEPRA